MHWRAVGRNAIRDVCRGNDRFVAVGRYGNVHWSTDGIHWWGAKSASNGTYHNLNAVCFGNGQFVAVGSNGLIIKSANGKDWSPVTSPITNDLFAVSWGQDRFVVTGNQGSVYSSTDGTTWTGPLFADTGPYPPIGDLRGVRFGNGVWAAVEGSNTRGLSSLDGVNWSRISTGAGYNLRMIFEGGYFAAVGGGSAQSSVARSTNGRNWNVTRAPENLTGIAYHPDNRIWNALATAGKIYRSTDLISWTLTGSTEAESAIAFGNGRFTAIGRKQVATSLDGITWTTQSRGNSASLGGVAWHKGHFVVVGDDGMTGWYDWKTDTLAPGTSPIARNLTGVVSNGTRCVAVSDRRDIISSLDGITWTDVTPPTPSYAESLDYVLGKFCAMGSDGTVHISADGLTWETHTTGSSDALFAVASNGTTALAVGSSDTLFASNNLRNWTELQPLPGFCLDIAYGNGVFVAMGFYGDIYLSSNTGATWTRTATLMSGWLGHITFAHGQFVVVSAYDGRIFISSDGITWSAEATGIESSSWLHHAAYGDGRFLVVGDYGQHLVSQRVYDSPAGMGAIQISRSPSGMVSISTAMPDAEGGIFRIDESLDLVRWGIAATDRTPAVDGLLWQGYYPSGLSAQFFRAATGY